MGKTQEELHGKAPDASVAVRMSERLVTDAEMLGGMSFEVASTSGTACVGTLDKFRCVADVGCDHGYVSIYLVQRGIAESAIAMDVRKGPLSMAESNIAEFGLQGKAQVRLSDGLSELNEGEADALVIAGMGGKLMISILEKKDLRTLGIRVAVLQPQSDIPEFRQYLRDKGYVILDERIVYEDGKYYFPMRVQIAGPETGDEQAAVAVPASGLERARQLFSQVDDESILRICNRYGEHNILRKDPLLKDFLAHGKEVAQSILKSLDEDAHKERTDAIKQEIIDIDMVLALYKQQ